MKERTMRVLGVLRRLTVNDWLTLVAICLSVYAIAENHVMRQRQADKDTRDICRRAFMLGKVHGELEVAIPHWSGWESGLMSENDGSPLSKKLRAYATSIDERLVEHIASDGTLEESAWALIDSLYPEAVTRALDAGTLAGMLPPLEGLSNRYNDWTNAHASVAAKGATGTLAEMGDGLTEEAVKHVNSLYSGGMRELRSLLADEGITVSPDAEAWELSLTAETWFRR